MIKIRKKFKLRKISLKSENLLYTYFLRYIHGLYILFIKTIMNELLSFHYIKKL